MLSGRVSRAVVFSAVAACSSEKAKPPPAAHGTEDLEKLLESEDRAVPHVSAGDDAAPVMVDAAAPVDAAVPADAAAPIDAGVRKRHHEQHKLVPPVPDHNIPKPYGAPPARRRIV